MAETKRLRPLLPTIDNPLQDFYLPQTNAHPLQHYPSHPELHGMLETFLSDCHSRRTIKKFYWKEIYKILILQGYSYCFPFGNHVKVHLVKSYENKELLLAHSQRFSSCKQSKHFCFLRISVMQSK